MARGRRKPKKSQVTVSTASETPLPVAPPVPSEWTQERHDQFVKDDAIYEKYRESIVTLSQDSAKEIDRTILTISTAALGLCLTIVKDLLVPGNRAIYGGWSFYSATVFFAVPIVLILFNLQCLFSSTRSYESIIDVRSRTMRLTTAASYSGPM